MSGHTAKRKHPYTSLNFWVNNPFWRRNPEGSLTSYNQEMYESILRGWISREKKMASLQSNIGK